jgi:hypothetical protein
MNGYEEFQRIMAEINRKKELERLRKEGKSDDIFSQFGNIFGGGFNFGGL